MEALPRELASQLPQVCYLLKWAVGASPEKVTTSFPGFDLRPRDVHTEYAQYGTSNSHTEYGLRSTSAANPVPRSVKITEPPPALLLSLAAAPPPLSPSYPPVGCWVLCGKNVLARHPSALDCIPEFATATAPR